MSNKEGTMGSDEALTSLTKTLRTRVVLVPRLIILCSVLCVYCQVESQTTKSDDAAVLKSELNRARRHDGPSVTDTEGDLASKGNIAAQKKILCDIEFADDARVRYDGLEALRQTGGWFAIREFATLVLDNPENTKPMLPKR